MKATAKNIGKLLVVILFTVLGMGAKAQTHVKSAPNCVLHDAYLKETSKTKNAVSCVDCYCKICGDKKMKEKEAKRKSEELANQKKNVTSQKNTTVKTNTKTKDNEVILVAPKPKVTNTDNTETKKNVEAQKETQIVSKKSKTINKEKIETLLNEISKVYADNKNFKYKYNFYCKFAFSGTKITITRTDRDYTIKHTFDLADIKSISHINSRNVSIKVDNVIYESGYYHYKGGETDLKRADWEIDRGFPITYANHGYGNVNYNDGNDKVFDLLREAALEAGATLEEKK